MKIITGNIPANNEANVSWQEVNSSTKLTDECIKSIFAYQVENDEKCYFADANVFEKNDCYFGKVQSDQQPYNIDRLIRICDEPLVPATIKPKQKNMEANTFLNKENLTGVKLKIRKITKEELETIKDQLENKSIRIEWQKQWSESKKTRELVIEQLDSMKEKPMMKKTSSLEKILKAIKCGLKIFKKN